MKSEAAESDRIKLESRHSLHRRKMSKISPIVNGADESLSYAAEDETVVRQINLAAAFHDHLSCTKSSELCKIDGSREVRVSLPCETDHIYANCSDIKKSALSSSPGRPKELSEENKKLKNVLIVQLNLIKQLEEEIAIKDRQIKTQRQESSMLKARLDRRDRMCLLRKRSRKPGEETKDNISIEDSSLESATNLFTVATPVADIPVVHEHPGTIPSVNLVTRYFGRRSKTIPSRALKRRYLGPPKTIPCKKPVPKSLSSATSISSTSEIHDDEIFPKTEVSKEIKLTSEKTSLIGVKKVSRKRGRRPKGICRKTDFLTTDKAYFLPDNRISPSPLICAEALIDVPSWKLKPVTSFYQMEGTENLNDPVYQRRHLKCEQDERRRKRWDIQRLREQKASEKLKLKYSRDSKESDTAQHKSLSFYPDIRHIQYIEVTDQLPVLAFGHLIPLFQPSEFSLSWKTEESQTAEPAESCPMRVTKKSRLSAAGPKVT